MGKILNNLFNGAAKKAWMGFVSAALPLLAAKTGLNLSGCEAQIVGWGETLIAAGIAGIGGLSLVYRVPNR